MRLMRKILTVRAFLVVFTIGGALTNAACHMWHHNDRPSEWADTVGAPPSDCPSISGTYENFSVPHQSSLIYSILGETDDGVSRVEIRQQGDKKLEILGWSINKLVKHAVLEGEREKYDHHWGPGNVVMDVNKRAFRCDRKGVHIDYLKHWEFSLAAFDRMRTYVTFQRATDGSLIMKYRDYGYLMMWYFIPWLSYSDMQWKRWAPYIEGTSQSKWPCDRPPHLADEDLPDQIQVPLKPPVCSDSEILAPLCQAAEKGGSEAQWRLASILYYGWYGVAKDHIRSYMWYSLASTGSGIWAEWATRQLVTRFDELSPVELAQAEQMVADWEPGQCESDLVPADVNN